MGETIDNRQKTHTVVITYYHTLTQTTRDHPYSCNLTSFTRWVSHVVMTDTVESKPGMEHLNKMLHFGNSILTSPQPVGEWGGGGCGLL